MKQAIFLPVMALIAFMALFTVISCDKEPAIRHDNQPTVIDDTDQITNGRPTANLHFEKIEDQNQFSVEGITFVQGESHSLYDIREKAPNFFYSNGLDEVLQEIERNPKKRAQPKRRVVSAMFEDCDCGAEYCQDLGRELYGKKGSYTQIAAASSGNPYLGLLYDNDPENLTNYGNYHYMYDQSWNADNYIYIAYFYYSSSGTSYSIDIDGPYTSSYNVRVYFDAYNENPTIDTTGDENAIKYYTTTCSTCSTCP